MGKDSAEMQNPESRGFRAMAGRHDPKILLREIAKQSCMLPEFASARKYSKGVTPWGLAAMARDSIAMGSVHNRAPVSDSIIHDLSYLFHNIMDDMDDDLSLISLIKFAYEQFPYQSSLKHDLARSYFLLDVVKISKFKGERSDWRKILGMSTAEAVASVLAIYISSRRANGMFPSGSLSGNYWDIFDRHIAPVRAIEATRDRLTTTVNSARGVYWERNASYKGSLQYSYNPLHAKPLVDLGEGYLVAPQPHLILNSMSPESLYYLGHKEGTSDCGSELGHRVEEYTGMLFSCMDGAKVHSETRMSLKQNDLSIDWIIVTKDVVLLVECKGAYMSLLGRAGDSQEVIKRSNQYLGHAVGQINRTYKEIVGSNPAFKAILPSIGNRAVYGLVVTGGPFHAANSALIKDHLKKKPLVPTIAASVNEIELLASLTEDELRDFLSTTYKNTAMSNRDIATAIHQQGLWREHRLLKQAYKKVIFPSRKLSRQERKERKKLQARRSARCTFSHFSPELIGISHAQYREPPSSSFAYDDHEWVPSIADGTLLRIG